MLWLLVFCAAFFTALWFIYRKVFWVRRSATLDPFVLLKGEQYEQRREKMLALIGRAAAIPFEEVHTHSHDGLKLYGRYYETAPGAPLQILFHGYRSNAVRDFSGGMQLGLQSGCNVLLVDQRAHGKSEGSCLSFGILERQDCLRWLDWAVNRFGTDTPIFLVGISMGAATVLMASELELPANVRGIISDCGYSSPRKIIQKVMRDMHYPIAPVYPLVRLAGRIFGGFDIESASAETALTRCRLPVLMIHGEDDRFVPCEMSRENFAACASRKTLLTVPEAGHGISFIFDREAYENAVKAFLKENL